MMKLDEGDLNYLNNSELKTFCKKHGILYSICIQKEDGTKKRTNEEDRKGIVLKLVRHFLLTREILPETCFPSDVVSTSPPPKNLKAQDKLFYGHYDKGNISMIALLKRLTKGKFENGAIARILLREFWSNGKAPTYEEFASAWLQAKENHKKPNTEWAFLSDLSAGKDVKNWKALRARKAKAVLAVLNRF